MLTDCCVITVFNSLHGAIPSFSEPNHLMWATATSCNLATNPYVHRRSAVAPVLSVDLFQQIACEYRVSGCTQKTWTQPTIFDSLNASGVSYKMYSNS